jgi:hypothetical protein
MSIYTGMTIAVTVGAFDQVTKFPVSTPACTVNFYAPPKNPRLNPTDRVADYTTTGTFDPNQNVYVATINTTGWVGGTWYYQGLLDDGVNQSWEYGTFNLVS